MAQISCDVLVGKSVMAIGHGDWRYRGGCLTGPLRALDV